MVSTLSEVRGLLQSVAQNDYMIDQHYLQTGTDLLEAAEFIAEVQQRIKDGRHSCPEGWGGHSMCETCLKIDKLIR